ncbi:MAG: hypothetical protein MUE53_08805 [Chitinophagales bacterium]|nr:hypothetical protein [Chitinophagales bacterium]
MLKYRLHKNRFKLEIMLSMVLLLLYGLVTVSTFNKPKEVSEGLSKLLSEEYKRFEQICHPNQVKGKSIGTLYHFQNNKLNFWNHEDDILQISMFDSNLPIQQIDLKGMQYIVFQKKNECGTWVQTFRINKIVEEEIYKSSKLFPNNNNHFELILSNNLFIDDAFKIKIRDSYSILSKFKPFDSDLVILAKFIIFFSLWVLYLIMSYQIVNYIWPLRPLRGLIFLGLSLFLVKYLIYFYKFPSFLYRLRLFNSKLLSISNLNASLGDLILFISILLTLSIFVYFRFPNSSRRMIRNSNQKFALFTSLFLGCLISVVFIYKTTQKIILNSSIWFEFDNLTKVNIYTAIGIICIHLLIVTQFLIINKIITYIFLRSKNKILLLFSALTAVLVLFIFLYQINKQEFLPMGSYSVIVIALIVTFYLKKTYFRILNNKNLFILAV